MSGNRIMADVRDFSRSCGTSGELSAQVVDISRSCDALARWGRMCGKFPILAARNDGLGGM
ncbi:hypothetical protein [Paenibacillus cremeus]|uniref:hypothetical protein n=1 Tax=Paenibacillus cremeus TaxID=2163881 RepID=UPI00119E5E14|nr:hypothetical protein [Paenibacillus cremeus]